MSSRIQRAVLVYDKCGNDGVEDHCWSKRIQHAEPVSCVPTSCIHNPEFLRVVHPHVYTGSFDLMYDPELYQSERTITLEMLRRASSAEDFVLTTVLGLHSNDVHKFFQSVVVRGRSQSPDVEAMSALLAEHVLRHGLNVEIDASRLVRYIRAACRADEVCLEGMARSLINAFANLRFQLGIGERPEVFRKPSTSLDSLSVCQVNAMSTDFNSAQFHGSFPEPFSGLSVPAKCPRPPDVLGSPPFSYYDYCRCLEPLTVGLASSLPEEGTELITTKCEGALPITKLSVPRTINVACGMIVTGHQVRLVPRTVRRAQRACAGVSSIVEIHGTTLEVIRGRCDAATSGPGHIDSEGSVIGDGMTVYGPEVFLSTEYATLYPHVQVAAIIASLAIGGSNVLIARQSALEPVAWFVFFLSSALCAVGTHASKFPFQGWDIALYSAFVLIGALYASFMGLTADADQEKKQPLKAVTGAFAVLAVLACLQLIPPKIRESFPLCNTFTIEGILCVTVIVMAGFAGYTAPATRRVAFVMFVLTTCSVLMIFRYLAEYVITTRGWSPWCFLALPFVNADTWYPHPGLMLMLSTNSWYSVVGFGGQGWLGLILGILTVAMLLFGPIIFVFVYCHRTEKSPWFTFCQIFASPITMLGPIGAALSIPYFQSPPTPWFITVLSGVFCSVYSFPPILVVGFGVYCLNYGGVRTGTFSFNVGATVELEKVVRQLKAVVCSVDVRYLQVVACSCARMWQQNSSSSIHSSVSILDGGELAREALAGVTFGHNKYLLVYFNDHACCFPEAGGLDPVAGNIYVYHDKPPLVTLDVANVHANGKKSVRLTASVRALVAVPSSSSDKRVDPAHSGGSADPSEDYRQDGGMIAILTYEGRDKFEVGHLNIDPQVRAGLFRTQDPKELESCHLMFFGYIVENALSKMGMSWGINTRVSIDPQGIPIVEYDHEMFVPGTSGSLGYRVMPDGSLIATVIHAYAVGKDKRRGGYLLTDKALRALKSASRRLVNAIEGRPNPHTGWTVMPKAPGGDIEMGISNASKIE
jgi:hypothetical protein